MADETHEPDSNAGVTIQVAPADPDSGGSPGLTEIATILVGVGFSIGLLFNVGFFLAMDLRLFPLLTYKDHLETLVIFTPIAIVPIVGSVILRRNLVWRRQATIIATGLGAGAFGAWFGRDEIVSLPDLSTYVVDAVFLAAFLLVAYCTAVILDRGLRINEVPVSDRAREESLQATSFSVAGLLVFVTLLGAAQAHIAMRPGGFDTQITLAGEGEAAVTKPAHLVRAIDTGLLVMFRETPGQITFVRNETVRSLSEPARP